ncbi:unnamed protein product [Cylicostephanus goldi]|uniref:Uncharacterized protein n=1 Tax=Cylicostephanus goldi TaxID=71465 RepID=A0A3P6RVT8_CYLGO|nr:unnamed protein product [Cylicostephanus goldi]
MSICHALLQVFLSTFVNAASELIDEVVDTTALVRSICEIRQLFFTNIALEILSAYNRKDLRDPEVVLYANSAATARLEYNIKVNIYKEAVTSAPVRALVDDVCASFTKIFEIIRPDFETQNGSSVYSNSLVDFGFALYTFAQDLNKETDQVWKDKRIHYLEAAVRALRDVLKRRGPRPTRSKAIEKITEIYYILLRLKSNAMIERASLFVPAKVVRTLYKDFADYVQAVQEHLIQLCYDDVRIGAKDIPLCFVDFTVGLISISAGMFPFA